MHTKSSATVSLSLIHLRNSGGFSLSKTTHFRSPPTLPNSSLTKSPMEVETHALSALNLNSSSASAFAFRNRSEFRISDVSGSSEKAPEQMKLTDRMAAIGVDRMATEDPVGGADAPAKCSSSAAMKVQKVYRSYRTRRMLADSAVVAEELWWQALDYAQLNQSTVAFFNFLKPETAAARWNRVGLNASKVGKGLSKDAKAQKLAFQHWIEAVDPRHRYGHNLHYYYEAWSKTNSGQPFFHWLDLGDGRDVDLKECPRSKLRQQCVKYLGPQEREHYEYVIVDGKILHKLTGKPLDTKKGSLGSKWIFVMSSSKKLYSGEKKKGLFHHSSFLAGGATLAAGTLTAADGLLKCVSPYSGHYRPTEDCLESFVSFLKENGVNLDEVEIKKANEDSDGYENGNKNDNDSTPEVPSISEKIKPSQLEIKTEYRRTLSGGLQSPKAEVSQTAILQRINSKKGAKSYQLGHQLSIKWSTGAGPRIGCIADYPVELRSQALQLTNLSPRSSPPLLPTPRRLPCPLSPSASPLNV